MSADDIHIYPINDLQEHITDGPGCPCEPRVEVVGADLVYVHNAFDHREIVEQAIDIMNDMAEKRYHSTHAFPELFIFGEYPDGFVDVSDGEKDVLTHVSRDQAEALIAERQLMIKTLIELIETRADPGVSS